MKQWQSRRGVETAIVLSIREYKHLKASEGNVADFFHNYPLFGIETDSERENNNYAANRNFSDYRQLAETPNRISWYQKLLCNVIGIDPKRICHGKIYERRCCRCAVSFFGSEFCQKTSGKQKYAIKNINVSVYLISEFQSVYLVCFAVLIAFTVLLCNISVFFDA